MNNPFKTNKGLVHVYTGDGKGKTTVALGLALRAIGWGGRVCMVQFIKGYSNIGEAGFAEASDGRFVLKQFAIDASRSIDEKKVAERKLASDEAMAYAEQVIDSEEFDIVILDEINNAMHFDLIDIKRVLKLIAARPEHVELVLTGRNAPESIVNAADYVTRLEMVKHPYESNIPARAGIDY
jgi:cob(I)alamin adenosyltransferase